ncbi:MAG TPA: diacylglycerol kinase family protein, partial [Aggregatilineales bacterium]|nr:diacylglycerol kinase family protein [Aggregatilineales bacterium]
MKPVDETKAKSNGTSYFALHPDIQTTLAIDPDHFSPITSRSRMASFRYALAGCLFVLRYQKNIRIQIVVSGLVFAVGLWVGLSPLAWALLIFAITLNVMVEFINTSIEAAVNLATGDLHPMARVAKDVAAGTSLLAAVAAAIIGGLVLAPPMLDRLTPLIVTVLRALHIGG